MREYFDPSDVHFNFPSALNSSLIPWVVVSNHFFHWFFSSSFSDGDIVRWSISASLNFEITSFTKSICCSEIYSHIYYFLIPIVRSAASPPLRNESIRAKLPNSLKILHSQLLSLIYYLLTMRTPSSSCGTNGPSLHSKKTELDSKHSTLCHTFLGISTP